MSAGLGAGTCGGIAGEAAVLEVDAEASRVRAASCARSRLSPATCVPCVAGGTGCPGPEAEAVVGFGAGRVFARSAAISGGRPGSAATATAGAAAALVDVAPELRIDVVSSGSPSNLRSSGGSWPGWVGCVWGSADECAPEL